MPRLFLTVVFVAMLLRPSQCAEDAIRYDPVSQQVIESRLQKYVGNDKQREETLSGSKCGDMWDLERYLTQRRKEIDCKYEFRISIDTAESAGRWAQFAVRRR